MKRAHPLIVAVVERGHFSTIELGPVGGVGANVSLPVLKNKRQRTCVVRPIEASIADTHADSTDISGTTRDAPVGNDPLTLRPESSDGDQAV